MKNAYFSTVYFGNVQYFCKLLEHPTNFIEQYENYIKQSYRNRCYVLGSNGIVKLTVPIKYGRSKILLKDVCITYEEEWQKHHFSTLKTAYKSSPYFDYYIYEYYFVFQKKCKFLLDLNLKILDKTFELLKLRKNYKLTESFTHEVKKAKDFRYSMHPKLKENKKDSIFYKPYWQVFAHKFGFQSNLSILDVFFNIGMESKIYLQSCINQTFDNP